MKKTHKSAIITREELMKKKELLKNYQLSLAKNNKRVKELELDPIVIEYINLVESNKVIQHHMIQERKNYEFIQSEFCKDHVWLLKTVINLGWNCNKDTLLCKCLYCELEKEATHAGFPNLLNFGPSFLPNQQEEVFQETKRVFDSLLEQGLTINEARSILKESKDKIVSDALGKQIKKGS
jgi:hypothetical protein